MNKIVFLLLAVCISSIAQATVLRNVEVDSVTYQLEYIESHFFYPGGPVTHATVLPSPAYKSMSSITIPDQITINDTVYDVVSIANSAFLSCTNLKRITLPKRLETIGKFALWNTGLTELKVPEAIYPPDFEYFGEYVLYSPDLVSFETCKEFPIMEEWYIKNAFPKIEKLVWNARDWYGSGATRTGGDSDGVYLVDCGFYDYEADVQVEMPKSLRQIVFGPDVEGIPAAFGAGTSIKAITLPPKLKIIRPNAFNNCQDLVAIHATSTDPASIELEWEVVKKWAANTAITLYVPRGTAQRYREAPQWCEFGDRIVEEDTNYDVNQDALTDIGDMNAVINQVLGIDSDTLLLSTDFNADGVVDIADVNAVINALLAK